MWPDKLVFNMINVVLGLQNNFSFSLIDCFLCDLQ